VTLSSSEEGKDIKDTSHNRGMGALRKTDAQVAVSLKDRLGEKVSRNGVGPAAFSGLIPQENGVRPHYVPRSTGGTVTMERVLRSGWKIVPRNRG
jgi:hypothetical protein